MDRSLVVVVESEESGETRYRLLETIRQYASERLTASGEENAIRGRCVIWCLRLVEQAKAN